MNEELREKLAEWAGFTKVEFGENLLPKWHVVGQTYDLWFDYPPDFPNSLDACFKWLVPKAHCVLGDKEFFKLLVRWCIKIITEGNEALALCLAIEKLIK